LITRWWAKDAALTKLFGKFADPEGCLYIDLAVTLEKDNMKPTVRAKADGYAEALLKYHHPHCPDVFTHLPTNNSTFQVFAN